MVSEADGQLVRVCRGRLEIHQKAVLAHMIRISEPLRGPWALEVHEPAVPHPLDGGALRGVVIGLTRARIAAGTPTLARIDNLLHGFQEWDFGIGPDGRNEQSS